MTFQFQSSLQDEDFENDVDDGYHHHHYHHPHPQNLSRLSVCTNSTTIYGVDYKEEDVDDAMAMCMSGLSIEMDDADADGEFSDGDKLLLEGFSSDSENENLSSFCPLLATPPRGRSRMKYYANDNEAQRGVSMKHKTKEKETWRKRCRRTREETRVWEGSEKTRSKCKKQDEDRVISGEGDQSGMKVTITRPKDGRRSLCMDLEEVKDCRNLGFELEIPSPLSVSLSNSTLDTSSGATSPVANWRISSPGDDPRDVKARLKMWAKAVVASASKYGT